MGGRPAPPGATMTVRYAIASREEVWVAGHCVESRLSHGEAITGALGITARDTADPELLERSRREMERLRSAMPRRRGTVRLISEACSDGDTSVMVLSEGKASIVTSAEHVSADVELLDLVLGDTGPAVDCAGVPILWARGTAAVLLHEAAGHPAELEEPPLDWPSWLSVTDGGTDLLAGVKPCRLRRASFRDVPLPRMSEVRVGHSGAPFELPATRIEVLLVGGGSYEPLTGTVTVSVVAADLVSSSGAVRVAPFVLEASRQEVARALRGAEGKAERYPGVVCSREGQEVIVESFAPRIVTVFG